MGKGMGMLPAPVGDVTTDPSGVKGSEAFAQEMLVLGKKVDGRKEKAPVESVEVRPTSVPSAVLQTMGVLGMPGSVLSQALLFKVSLQSLPVIGGYETGKGMSTCPLPLASVVVVPTVVLGFEANTKFIG